MAEASARTNASSDRRRCGRALLGGRALLAVFGFGLAWLCGLAGPDQARAGIVEAPAPDFVVSAAAHAEMVLAERRLAQARLVERQARLDREIEVATASRRGVERTLRRLAADYITAGQGVAELEAAIAGQSERVTRKQQRLEALLAEIVQLSRDEHGEPRRLGQLRAVAASLAGPFAAAKGRLGESRRARASLEQRLADIEQASFSARHALAAAEARGERLARLLDANRAQTTEASGRERAAAAASLVASLRLDRVAASRTVTMLEPPPAVARPATAATPSAAPSAMTLAVPVLTARAVVSERPHRRAVHFDLPKTAALAGAVLGSTGGGAGSGQVVPIAGAVISRFGEGQKPPFDRGLTIEVEDRRLVRAPRDGRVVFARAYEGFGLLLIIDHGSEYHSLLSGLSRFVVHEGWSVRAGQMVGTLEPGTEAAGRLYVELRRRGIPVDPLTWFAAGQDKVRS